MWFLLAVVVIAVAAIAWGWFEAGWVRYRVLDVDVPGLPPSLDGARLVHLSDFHLGVPSRGEGAVARAVGWTAARDPDLVLVTGDLLSRPRGEERLRELVARLPRAYAILGNHDLAVSRDPFSTPARVDDLGTATLLSDEGRRIDVRGHSVWIAGVDPASRGAENGLAQEADLRILLTHFPNAVDRIDAGSYDLILAGHMHDGQICIPYPGGKLRLAHLRTRYTRGLYRRPAGLMHVSPGLGTTFVPFRFCARPEATELVLHST